jgi:hypothetical protein
MNADRFIEVMTGDEFTSGEKFICQAQYRNATLSSFESALWTIMCAADDYNMGRLALAYPDRVQAFLQWRLSDLRQRLEGRDAA